MKTVLFFARENLASLYGHISENLSSSYNIVFVAYSEKEEKVLREQFQIDKVINFKKVLKNTLNIDKIDYLLLDEIDHTMSEMTDGRFTLNSSIQSDRGFSILSYKESLALVQTYYLIWEELIKKYDVNYFIHEFVSLSMNHIASIVCKKNNALYVTEMQVRGIDKFNLLFINFENGIPVELRNTYNNLEKRQIVQNISKINVFLDIHLNDTQAFFSYIGGEKFRFIKLIKQSIKEWIVCILKKNKYDKILDNIDYYLLHSKSASAKIINILKYKLFIRWDIPQIKDTYYYYPLHLEPEATVNYLADGIYKNQIKLLENIAAQLPAGTYLYVKDHPHDIGYRELNDYLKLKAVPNIKLLHANISGNTIIQNSKGVITLNGTAGFEGILLGKPVFTFGKAFYSVSPLSTYVHNIRDLKEKLLTQFSEEERREHLNKLVLALINSSYSGNTNCFYGAKNKLKENKQNIINLQNSYKLYLDKMSTYVK